MQILEVLAASHVHGAEILFYLNMKLSNGYLIVEALDYSDSCFVLQCQELLQLPE